MELSAAALLNGIQEKSPLVANEVSHQPK